MFTYYSLKEEKRNRCINLILGYSETRSNDIYWLTRLCKENLQGRRCKSILERSHRYKILFRNYVKFGTNFVAISGRDIYFKFYFEKVSNTFLIWSIACVGVGPTASIDYSFSNMTWQLTSKWVLLFLSACQLSWFFPFPNHSLISSFSHFFF